MFKPSLINHLYKPFSVVSKLPLFLYILPLFLVFCSCSLLNSPSKSNLTLSMTPLMVDASESGLSQLLDNLYKLDLAEQKAQMAAFHAKVSNSILQQKSAYVLGRILQKTKSREDYETALPLFEQAAQLNPIWTLSNFHISECAQELGNEKKVRQALTAIIDRSKDDESIAKAKYGLAQSYLRANENDKALETFLSIKNNYPNSQFALGSSYYIAENALAKNNSGTFRNLLKPSQDAIALFRNYLKLSPDGRFAQEIVNELSNLPGFTPTPADHNLFAAVYFAQNNYKAALKEWSIGKNKDHWYQQAICLKNIGKAKEAQILLGNGIHAFPNDAHIPDAVAALTQMLPQAQSLAVYKSLASQSSKYKDLAFYNIAIRSPQNQGFPYFKQIVVAYPNSDFAPESLWRLMWGYCQQGNFKAALTLSDIGHVKYTNAKAAPRYTFWAGKIYERSGDKTKAADLYQLTVANYGNTYYGHRAKQRLEALSGKHDHGWQTDNNRHLSGNTLNWSWPNTSDLIAYENIKQTEGPALAMLFELAQWDECLEMLPESNYPLLRSLCLAKLNLPLEAINAATRYLKGIPNNEKKWQLAYPLLYADSVSRECAVKGVDPFLAQALIREESRYKKDAISRSNAHGLMQLLPSTAAATAKHLGIHLSGNTDLHKPETNIKLGVDYLSYVLRRFNGNALFAVASYNGGPNAVSSWSKRFSMQDPDIFVESIPYSETRDYVRKVFASYWNYQDIYR